MNARNYIIGTGFYHARTQAEWAYWFWSLWLENVMKHTPLWKVFVVANGDCEPPWTDHHGMDVLHLPGNLGHVGQLLSGEKPHHICGWSGTIVTLAMIAYCNESDFIYQEQDCLAFGPFIEKMYEEIGDAGMIFGSCKLMPAAQSLFLIKHEFIPKFIRRYMSGEAENTDAWLPEKKFARMASESPDQVKRFSFPFDRDRPLDLTLPVWYAQKFTPAELRIIAAAGFIDITGMPEVKIFSNTE
jgi:hypothetical protein